VWVATRYTADRLDKTGQALRDGDGPTLEGHEAREKGLLAVHFPPRNQRGEGQREGEELEGGEGFQLVNEGLVAAMMKKASSTAPGEYRISANILKGFWEWDQQIFTGLVRACIRVGHHPELWKMARGVVIPKANKPDYSQVRAYRVISLLDTISKLVERMGAHLIADHLERSKGLHEGQYGCRRRRATVDAVAMLMNRTERVWECKKLVGMLLMDVQAAFNNTNSRLLRRRMRELGVQEDIV